LRVSIGDVSEHYCGFAFERIAFRIQTSKTVSR
jgi:hypothetical protein